MKLSDARRAALEIYKQRYEDAAVILLAGSIVRGDATRHSDLDLVIVYEKLEQARRESFHYENWPVEAFVHDPKTLDYFFRHVDCATGVPSLSDMVSDGMEVPEPNETSKEIKALAREVLAEGPPLWSDADKVGSRYAITGMIDDIRSPRSICELRATLAYLYPAMIDHFFRSRGLWSAKGKSIHRKLTAMDPELAKRVASSFDAAVTLGDTEDLIRLAEDLLEPDGGFHFDGDVRLAPKEWRTD